MIRLVGRKCAVKCLLNGVETEALWDTGDQVSIIPSNWVRKSYPGTDVRNIAELLGMGGLDLKTANGTDLPYKGWVELTFSELTLTGYSVYHSFRQTRGGGVGILIKDGFDISRSTISTHQFQTFEFMDMQIKTSLSRSVCIIIIYRPPLSSNHDCTTDHFMVEFRSLLEQYVTDSFSLLITGDFNLHVDNNLDKSLQDFLALIDSFNLKQHVCSPTHRAGHILDLLITRDDGQLVTSVSIHDAAFSDHFVVNCALSMEKPLFTKKQIIYCSFKNFDIDLFISDSQGSSLIIDPPNELDDLVALYDSELSGIFNRHVPIKKRTITIRPAAPWYSEELKSEKREKDGLSNGGVLPVLYVIVKLTCVNVKFLRTCYLHQEVIIIQI